MRVFALTEGPDHVCYRYRIEAFAWAMAERGLLLEAVPLARQTWRRMAQFRAMRRADVVILQRRLLPLWQLVLLRRAAARLVYDVDDAVFQRDSYSRKGPESWSRTARFWATVYSADAIIAGNEFLQRSAAVYADPHRIHVIPTCLEPDWYRPAEHRRTGAAARLAWIGQRSTLASLGCMRPHFAAIGARLPGLELRLISDRSIDLPAVSVVPRRWSKATEASDLAEADIGISWLPDDTWSRGKCGLRVLQYMAAGLPVVANPVGIHRQMVVEGETGLLASTPRQWSEAIARLAADPTLRRRLGEAGRRLVETHYSVAGWGPRFAEAIASVGTVPIFAANAAKMGQVESATISG